MKGVNYLTNDEGQKVAVQLDLTIWQSLWEQIQPIIESPMNNSWTKEELESLSRYVPESLNTDEDFSDWLAMPTIQ
ncbi:MAG: hypothetical protein RLZZ306_976 [Bacteroidota bacterium]|jgi:hypothetical protein